MIDMLGRKKNRSIKKALEPYKAEAATCPICGMVDKLFYRTPQGLVCRQCREGQAWPSV